MCVYGILVSEKSEYLFSTLYVEYLINKNPNSLTTRDWCSSSGMAGGVTATALHRLEWDTWEIAARGKMAKRCWLLRSCHCRPELGCLMM